MSKSRGSARAPPCTSLPAPLASTTHTGWGMISRQAMTVNCKPKQTPHVQFVDKLGATE
jgi:hypothetical protein